MTGNAIVDEAALLKSAYRDSNFHDKPLTSDQLKRVLRAVGAPGPLVLCVDELVQLGGYHREGIEFESFVDWLFAEDPDSTPALPGARWASQLNDVFNTLSDDGAGYVDANVLAEALLGMDHGLSEADILAVIREADMNGDGFISCEEFSKLVEAPEPPAASFQPHLVLYFDINQTVVMTDSVTSSDARALLNEVVANAAWGYIVGDGGLLKPSVASWKLPLPLKGAGAPKKDGEDGVPVWKLVSTIPELQAPAEGLCTYCQFVRQTVESKAQRGLLRAFCEPGAPGESLSAHVDSLARSMELPSTMMAMADPGLLEECGLSSGMCCLLPSFLVLVRWLKAQGRSFSLCFRTFGLDIAKVAIEFNALCQNRHPLFFHHSEWIEKVRATSEGRCILTDVVLDGTDGLSDMRLDMSPGGNGCGTWVRGGDGSHVVFGDLRQPPPHMASSTDLAAFYAELAENTGCDDAAAKLAPSSVDIVLGAAAVRDRLREMLHIRSAGRTLGLRDYYPAWDGAGRTSVGGKPLFLETKDPSIFQIFFDDHILPQDAHILDIQHADSFSRGPLPIGAVLGVHAVRAEPLHSITDPMYFVKSLKDAEERWRAACSRRRILADVLKKTLREDGGTPLATRSPVTISRYLTHTSLKEVLLATNTNAFVSDDPSSS